MTGFTCVYIKNRQLQAGMILAKYKRKSCDKHELNGRHEAENA
jgi:hypothetical protein